MQLLLLFILYVAIIVAEDPVYDDTQPFDSYDIFADSDATQLLPGKDSDLSERLSAIDLAFIPSSDSLSVTASSCLTENEQPFNRLRARIRNSYAVPFKKALPRSDNILNMIDGSSSEETLPEDSLLELPVIDTPKSSNCLPNFPYHVYCDLRGPISDDFPSMPVLVFKYLLHCDMGMQWSPRDFLSQLS